MLYTLAFIVVCSAVVLFFAQEFIRTFKRIFEIKGAKLFLPLACVSWAISEFNDEFLIGVYYLQQLFQNTWIFLIHHMPFEAGAYSLALILLLTLISVVPVFIMHFILLQRSYQGYQYPYLTSAFIWIVCSLFFLTEMI